MLLPSNVDLSLLNGSTISFFAAFVVLVVMVGLAGMGRNISCSGLLTLLAPLDMARLSVEVLLPAVKGLLGEEDVAAAVLLSPDVWWVSLTDLPPARICLKKKGSENFR